MAKRTAKHEIHFWHRDFASNPCHLTTTVAAQNPLATGILQGRICTWDTSVLVWIRF